MVKKDKFISHLTFWALFESISFYVNTLPFFSPGPGHILLFTSTTIASLLTSQMFFYTNHSLLLPHFLAKKNHYSYLFLLSLNVVFFFITKAYIWHNFTFVPGLFSRDAQIPTVAFMGLFYFLMSVAFYILESWKDSELRKELLEKEIKETELLYLKSQMNPHFLFNTLNNIYGLSLNNNQNIVFAIRHLKNLMLYNERFVTSNRILLSEEVNYLNSYIQLHKLRNTSNITFKYEGEEFSNHIEPMLLIPFIENAFKHGAYNENEPIEILIKAQKDEVYFKISNFINHNKRKDKIGGIGISNVKRRLELLYVNKHRLITHNDNNLFSVELQLTNND